MKNLLTYSILLILCTIGPLSSSAQYDSIVNNMQLEFDKFKKGIQQEHQLFIYKNDSLFSSFLKESWETYNTYFKSQPDKPKPSEQPTVPSVDPPKSHMQPIQPIERRKVEPTTPSSEYKLEVQLKKPLEYDKMGSAPASISFYGCTPSLFLPSALPFIKKISNEEIGHYFDLISNILEINHLTLQLQALKHDLQLNDWGYLQLVQATSEKIYANPPEQILLSWVLLLKSGFNVKVGYNADQIFLLVPSIQEMYNHWYLNVNQASYYIISSATKENSFPKLTVHKADYPDTRPLSLELLKIPQLGAQTIFKELISRNDTILIPINKNLVKFYENYPLSDLGIYFSAPISNEVLFELDKILLPLLKDQSALQKVGTLLQFSQKSFKYKTDKEQFGREKFFFPDEIFFYAHSDCEDRSILFSKLIRHYTKLDCIGLEFPNHVNTAVYIPGNTNGVMVSMDDKQFTVCDPTYRNAPPGYLADEYKKTSPRIITAN